MSIRTPKNDGAGHHLKLTIKISGVHNVQSPTLRGESVRIRKDKTMLVFHAVLSIFTSICFAPLFILVGFLLLHFAFYK